MLRGAVVDGDESRAVEYAEKALAADMDPAHVIESGLSEALRSLGDMFERREVFLPELVLGSEAMKASLEVLRPHLGASNKPTGSLGRVLLGTVEGDIHEEGDIHDIGKNLVATLLTIEGFEVFDLGVDVSASVFVEKVRELGPDVVGLSALLTMSILEQEKVVMGLVEAGLRDSVKVLVGGAPVSLEYAERIGADGYGVDGFDAVRKAKELLEKG
jgi:corrinoid protein of di/trimethylamine methyltransferase